MKLERDKEEKRKRSSMLCLKKRKLRLPERRRLKDSRILETRLTRRRTSRRLSSNTKLPYLSIQEK
jgi:hypothetical protein